MGRIIRLTNRQHDEVQALLPWSVTGRLDSKDQALVDAHVAECAHCRADLAADRRIRAEIAAIPVDADQRWLRLRARILARPGPERRKGAAGLIAAVRPRVVSLAKAAPQGLAWWLAAAQALLVAGLLARPPAPVAAYHALGSASAPAVANLIVMFRPETPAVALTATLRDNRVRLVDGPTAAGAYLGRAPLSERGEVLSRLRRRSDIVLAEPIDSGAPN